MDKCNCDCCKKGQEEMHDKFLVYCMNNIEDYEKQIDSLKTKLAEYKGSIRHIHELNGEIIGLKKQLEEYSEMIHHQSQREAALGLENEQLKKQLEEHAVAVASWQK